MTMTRKKAIQVLQKSTDNTIEMTIREWEEFDKEVVEAIDMAIEALQGDMYCPNCGVRLVPEDEYLEPTQTHGRLIDADALLDKLPKVYFGSTIHSLILDAPTISIAQDWIPCSEGLPSDEDNVFVTVIDDHGDTPYRYTDVAWLCNGTWIADNEILCGNAIAWMPRPKPYKGGEDK